jgi:hypothetical protein
VNEEELYNDIVEKLSSGDFLQLNDYINAQQQEIERLNNIINSLEETLNKLIKEQLEQYHKREENWEERRNISNTWLTSRDCYYSILKYLQELKGVDKE